MLAPLIIPVDALGLGSKCDTRKCTLLAAKYIHIVLHIRSSCKRKGLFISRSKARGIYAKPRKVSRSGQPMCANFARAVASIVLLPACNNYNSTSALRQTANQPQSVRRAYQSYTTDSKHANNRHNDQTPTSTTPVALSTVELTSSSFAPTCETREGTRPLFAPALPDDPGLEALAFIALRFLPRELRPPFPPPMA